MKKKTNRKKRIKEKGATRWFQSVEADELVPYDVVVLVFWPTCHKKLFVCFLFCPYLKCLFALKLFEDWITNSQKPMAFSHYMITLGSLVWAEFL